MVEVWTAHRILGVEMGLGAMKIALERLGGLGVPVGIIVVVVLVVIDRCWCRCRWVVRDDSLLVRRLAVRIVVPWIGHVT